MRLGLKYPSIFSVVAAASGDWDWSLEVWPGMVEMVQRLQELPRDISDLDFVTGWWIQIAAAITPRPDNPLFYSEIPFRIVDGHGEFVPGLYAKFVEIDSIHEARRYLQQPLRLRGILLWHGVDDAFIATTVSYFEQELIELGIAHDYVEKQASHCDPGWEAASLKFLSEKLVFEAE